MVERHGGNLAVYYRSGPILRVAYNADAYAEEENAELAQLHPQTVAMLSCDGRFEVMIDDLDAKLQDYNTLFAIQEGLVGATGGLVFNS